MAVTIAPAFRDALRPQAVVVFTVLAADPAGRLPQALVEFGRRLTAAPYVSRPVPVPGGHLMLVDLGKARRQVMRSLPDLLGEELTTAGITDATVEIPPAMGERYYDVWAFTPAARAFLAAPVAAPWCEGAGRTPRDLLVAALAWLRGQPGPDVPPHAIVMSAEIPLTWQTALPVGAGVLASGQTRSATLVTDFATTLSAAVVSNGFHGASPRASLTAAGADGAPGAVADRMRGQRELIRVYPHPLGWAAVTAEPDAQWTLLEDWVERPGDRSSREDIRQVHHLASDVLIPDAMWYQVLTPGHLGRLGGPPPGAVALRDGTYELTIGEPAQWLPGHPDRCAIRDRGRDLLAGCLSTEDTAREVSGARVRQWRGEDTASTHRCSPE